MAGGMRWIICGMLLAVAACAGGPPDAGGPVPRDLTRPLLDAATQAMARGDAVTAATYFRSVHAREPDNAQATLGLIESLRGSGGLAEARTVAAKAPEAKPAEPPLLEKAAAADPRDWRTRSALGIAYDRLGAWKKADRSYRAALAIAPENATVLNNFALSRAMAGNFAAARALAQRAVAAAGADLRVKQNLALIDALSGKMKEAETLTRRDLPPAVAGATIDYYRTLAAAPV